MNLKIIENITHIYCQDMILQLLSSNWDVNGAFKQRRKPLQKLSSNTRTVTMNCVSCCHYVNFTIIFIYKILLTGCDSVYTDTLIILRFANGDQSKGGNFYKKLILVSILDLFVTYLKIYF